MKIIKKVNKKSIFITMPKENDNKSKWLNTSYFNSNSSNTHSKNHKVILLSSGINKPFNRERSNIDSFFSQSIYKGQSSNTSFSKVSNHVTQGTNTPKNNFINLSAIIHNKPMRKKIIEPNNKLNQSINSHTSNSIKSNIFKQITTEPSSPFIIRQEPIIESKVPQITMKYSSNMQGKRTKYLIQSTPKTKAKVKKRRLKRELFPIKKLPPSYNYTDEIMKEKTDQYLNNYYAPIKRMIEENNKININEVKHQINITTSITEIPLTDNFSNKYHLQSKYIHYNHKPSTNTPNSIIPSTNIFRRIQTKTITRHLHTKKSIDNQVNIIHLHNEEYLRSERLIKWKRVIITAAIDFNRLHIKMEDLMLISPSSLLPYQDDLSIIMFQSIKAGDKDTFIDCLYQNRLLLLNYDHSKQTVLHWMAKRNRYDWISLAVHNGANVNAKDCTGRTPLHYAVISNHLESVMILLYEMASPFIYDNFNKKPGDLTRDYYVLYVIKRAVLLYVIHAMKKIQKLSLCIKMGMIFVYNNELKLGFIKEKYRFGLI